MCRRLGIPASLLIAALLAALARADDEPGPLHAPDPSPPPVHMTALETAYQPDVPLLEPDGSYTGLGAHPPTCVWEYYGPRFGISYEAGDGIGFEKNFTTLQAMLPLCGTPGERLAFADLRWLADDSGQTGLNLGLAYRWYDERLDRTFGLLGYYDRRQVFPFAFEQFSVGLETLGPCWDARINAYLPGAFDNRQTIPQQFAGNFLLLDQSAAGMNGIDFEFGVPLAACQRFQPKAFAGMYYFAGESLPGAQVPSTTGVRARLEGSLGSLVRLNLALQNDPLFDTTFSLQIAVRFPFGGESGCTADGSHWERICRATATPCDGDRLDDPVRRLQNVVVQSVPGVIATDPAGGQPLQFLHVAQNGLRGDGSFENPYGSLAELFNDPRYQAGNVIGYVSGDSRLLSQFMGNVLVPANTQLLSSGPVQQVLTQRGARQLPYSGADPSLAFAPGILGDVTLSNDTTFSGFEVQGRILGDGITGFDINNNRISFADGIALTNIIGSGAVANNQLNGGSIAISGTMFQGDVAGNRVQNSSACGLELTVDAYQGTIGGNTIESAGADGICIDVNSFTGQITGNTIDGSAGRGASVTAESFNGSITGNSFLSNSSLGLALETDGSGQASNAQVQGNTLRDNDLLFGGTEMEVVQSDATGVLVLQLSGNSSSNTVPPPDFNYDLLNSAGGTFTVQPVGVNAANTGTVGSSDGSVTIP